MSAPVAGPRSFTPVILRQRDRLDRCFAPACGHVHARFPAPRHLLAPHCSAVDWWFGCVAAFAGVCLCPSCPPRPVDGPTRSGCGCPPSEPYGLL